MTYIKKLGLNPYLPGYEYVPDGEPYVFGDRVYIYGSHDSSHGENFCLEDYVCWSADINELGEWIYEGIIYKKNQDPMNVDGSHKLFAPDVSLGPDGRYYLYYALDTVGVIAVAVCDKPAGEYEFYGYVQYKTDNGEVRLLREYMPYDPAVLLDDDKHIYLYYGFCPHFDIPWVDKSQINGGMMIELEGDMLTIKNGPQKVLPSFLDSKGTGFEGHAYFEAPSIRKIMEKYYLVYSSENLHELCYAVSSYPNKGFKYGGVIISNGDIGYKGRSKEDSLNYIGNNHGGLVQINENWYMFYHRHTQATQFSRQGCAEQVFIDEEGSIDQVEMTSCGLNNGPLPAIGEYSAHHACNLIGPNGAKLLVRVEGLNFIEPHFNEDPLSIEEKEREQFISNIQNGTKVGFKYFDFIGSEKSIILKVRGTSKGFIKVIIQNKSNDDSLKSSENEGEYNIDSDTWVKVPIKIHKIKGTKSITFQFLGDGRLDFRAFVID